MPKPRPDGYWFAYIVKLQKRTQFKVQVEITGPEVRSLKALMGAGALFDLWPWRPRSARTGHVIVPLQFP
jgi:hypothetical protein